MTEQLDAFGAVDALATAMTIAMEASQAQGGEPVAGSATCPKCGGRFDYRASVPSRRKVFVRIQCRTKGCLALIT
jgi:hypothetical protein